MNNKYGIKFTTQINEIQEKELTLTLDEWKELYEKIKLIINIKD